MASSSLDSKAPCAALQLFHVNTPCVQSCTHCTNSPLECTNIVYSVQICTHCTNSPLECTNIVYSVCNPGNSFGTTPGAQFWTERYSVTRLSKWPVIWQLTSWQSPSVLVGVACSTGSVFESGKVPKETRCRACDVMTLLSDWTVVTVCRVPCPAVCQ